MNFWLPSLSPRQTHLRQPSILSSADAYSLCKDSRRGESTDKIMAIVIYNIRQMVVNIVENIVMQRIIKWIMEEILCKDIDNYWISKK